eukprot:2653895-Rhodomonas_salina.1
MILNPRLPAGRGGPTVDLRHSAGESEFTLYSRQSTPTQSLRLDSRLDYSETQNREAHTEC